MSDEKLDYGKLAEDAVEKLCNISFISDFVFRSPKFNRGKLQKELCDVLVIVQDIAVIIEVKCPDIQASKFWDKDKIQRWCDKNTLEAHSQIVGGIRTLSKGLIQEVHNERYGTLNIAKHGIKRVYSIAAIHAPSWYQFSMNPPPIKSAYNECYTMLVSIFDLHVILHELSTICDLIDYLDARSRIIKNRAMKPFYELDMLAAFKIQFPKIKQILDLGMNIHFPAGGWKQYSEMGVRSTRDKQNIPSYIIDDLINELHKSRGYLPNHIPDRLLKSGAQPSDQYPEAAIELNLLRRIERRYMGENLLKKFSLLSQGNRPRHFAHQAHTGTMFLFLISNDERKRRLETLDALLFCIEINLNPRKLVGIAVNSPDFVSSSIDCITVVPDPDQPHSPSEEDRDLFRRFFTPPRTGKISEYKPSRPIKNRYKRRKRKK